MIEHKFSAKDKQWLQKMRGALDEYIGAAIFLSREAWDALRKSNAIVWQEVEIQRNFLKVCVSSGVVEFDDYDE